MNVLKCRQISLFFIIIYALGYYSLLLCLKNNVWLATLVENCFDFIGLVITFIVLVMTLLRARKQEKLFWLLFSSWAAFCGSSLLVYAYNQIVLKIANPNVEILNVLFLMGYLCELVAIFYIVIKRSNFWSIRVIFDTLITITVGTTLYWLFIIGPALKHETLRILVLNDLIFPVFDLVILFGVVSIIYSSLKMMPKNAFYFVLAQMIVNLLLIYGCK